MSYNFPNVIEMEKALLSAMWLKEGKVIPEVAGIVRAEDFYRPQHQMIFSATLEVYNRGVVPDVLTVEEELKKRGEDTKVGRTYLFGLIDCEFTTARATVYATEIVNKAKMRRLINLGEELAYEAREETKTVEELLTTAEAKIAALAKTTDSRALQHVKETAQFTFENVLERKQNAGGLQGLSTGFYDLDPLMGGLKKSDMIILAARPSMGKTALALNIAANVSLKNVVAIFSLEMSRAQLGERLVSSLSGVPASKIQTGNLNDNELSKIADGVTFMENRHLYLDDTGCLTIPEIRMRAKQLQQTQGLDLIIIDYIQLIQGSKEYRGNRVQEVSEISRGIKALARELDVPILALSQLSRGVEMRAEKKPQLSDLRESGSLEQDADIVMFLYRDEYYNRDEEDKMNLAEVIIAKNRNGAIGSATLHFNKNCVLFRNLTRKED